MRVKVFTRVQVLAAVAAMIVLGALATGASASVGKSATEVTIKGENGDFYGNVKSSDPSCAEGRKVTVFKLKGSSPNPSVDRKITSDTASLSGGKYRWSVGNTGEKNGFFYARVVKNDHCTGDISPVISS
jgi:hypothetical protein